MTEFQLTQEILANEHTAYKEIYYDVAKHGLLIRESS